MMLANGFHVPVPDAIRVPRQHLCGYGIGGVGPVWKS